MIVHQTLHGYADGHRLLATSTPLSTEDQHTLALLSDISGHGGGVVFDAYLSGYPVRPGLYALARTWNATEVARAGSVWTHTLLVADTDLADVHGLAPLVGLFRRPDGGDWLPYSTPIELPDERVAGARHMPPSVSPDVVAQVVSSLYDPVAPRAVRVITDDRGASEPFALACWLQQWPSLRARFTFCTLALGDVGLPDAPFALQLVPRERSGDLAPSDAVATVDAGASAPPVPSTGWVRETVDDLIAETHDRSLRAFLWRFGDDASNNRAGLSRLAEVYAQLRAGEVELGGATTGEGLTRDGVRRATRLVAVVGDRFPSPAAAARLKLALFGGVAAPEPRPAGLSEADMLLALAISRVAAAFDADSLAVADRAARLLETQSATALRLTQAALEIGLNRLGEVAIGPLLSGAGGDLLSRAVARNVGLAAKAGVWSVPIAARQALWAAVTSVDPVQIDDATRVGIVRAVLEANCTDLADAVVTHFGATAAETVLAWLAESDPVPRRLDPAWIRALGRETAVLLAPVVREGALHPATLSVIAEALDPDSDDVSRIPLDTWLTAATRAATLAPESVDFKAFLLAVALDRRGAEAASLAVLAFQPVYDAARQQRLGAVAWSRLQTRVPRILRQWDHNERLRRAVAVRFARGDWPMTYLPQVVRGELALDLLLGHCLETEAGRRFVVKVVKGVPRPIRWGAAQRAVVQRFVAKAAARQRA